LLAAIFAGGGVLTAVSLAEDAGDPEHQASVAAAEAQARRARALAREHGVPAAGGLAVYATEPLSRAPTTFAERCAGCHQGDEREGPEIGPGFGSRAHLRAFLLDPGGERFFGRTSINLMRPVTLTGADLDAMVEMLYAESGAPDADPALVVR